METVTVQRTRTTLDLLLWRRFGIAGMALVEEAMNLNPGIAGLGAILPVGTVVTFPAAPVARAAPARRVLSLFGDE